MIPLDHASALACLLICVLRYVCVEFHRSAFKHGCTIEAITHAVEDAIAVVELDPESDPPKVLAIVARRSRRRDGWKSSGSGSLIGIS